MRLLKNKYLVAIVIAAIIFRFYDLDWGEGHFFHPDEYHIAISVDQMSFPDQMHPHFFSYGTFISYLIYFSKQLAVSLRIISENTNPILIGRFFSALFSTATIPVIYLLTVKIAKKRFSALLASGITAFSPGLIQQAHYATPESLLIFWILLSLLLILYWLEKNSYKYILLSAISFGAALSIKVSGLIFFPAHALAILIQNKLSLSSLTKKSFLLLIFIATAFLTFFTIYPYSILDWKGFRHSMNYETGVGRGDPLVFYTRQFIDTTPILFQYKKILPYVMDPLTITLGTAGVFYAVVQLIKQKFTQKNIAIILTAFLLFFISSSFLFAKWTRFIIPAVPFFALFTSLLVDRIKNHRFCKLISIFIIFSALLWSLTFFQIYLRPDVRAQADHWLNENLPPQSFVLTEAGNMLEVPLTGSMRKHSFDFYHLDENPQLETQLINKLEEADYFIVQSRRIYYNHQRLPNKFPLTNRFYDNLFGGKLGFEHIKTVTSYPTIPRTNIKIEDEDAEETWTVFDHPVVRIYEKTEPMTAEEYRELLGI